MSVIEANFTPNAAKFFENYVNVEHVVLGKKLQPCSLRHILMLQNIGSPLFYPDIPFSLGDLEIAVLICSSRSNEEFLAKVNVKGWLRTIPKRLWHNRNKKKLQTRALFLNEVRKFFAYHDDYNSLPEFKAKNAQSEHLELFPGYLEQMARLIKNTGWTDDKVFSMSLGQIVWLNTAFRYLESGESVIISDQDQANMAALTELTKGAG